MQSLCFVVADLARNPLYTAAQFAGALEPAERGTAAPAHRICGWSSDGIWPPLVGEPLDVRRLPGWSPLVPGPAAALATHARGCSAVYAFKALPSSLGLALRTGSRLGLPVGLHLDDWDAGFFQGVSGPRRLVRGLRDWRRPHSDLWLRVCERAIPHVDFLTVSSRALQSRFGGTLVRQGVDTNRFAPERHPRAAARERLGLDPQSFVAVFAGTPRAHKGVLRAARAVERVGGRTRLLVAGVTDPSLRSRLHQLGVQVLGSYPFAEAGWVLAAADVAVLAPEDSPYARHQLPAKLLHALALGVPVISTDVGDAREILETGPAGTLVPPADEAALARALQGYLLDEDLRARHGRSGREACVRFWGWDAMRARLHEVLTHAGVEPDPSEVSRKR